MTDRYGDNSMGQLTHGWIGSGGGGSVEDAHSGRTTTASCFETNQSAYPG